VFFSVRMMKKKASTWRSSTFSPVSGPAPRPRFGIIYVVLFLAIFGALDYGYYLTRGTVVERLLIDTLTVRPAAAVIDVIAPAALATANGNSLFTPFGRINILGGCEGSEGMFLLIAAVLPFPARWRAKLAGVIGGVALMYAINQLRILTLALSFCWHRDWFAPLHGLIAPTCIVVAGCIFFFAWASIAAPRADT
jgi:exosortase family protein XrtM